MIGFGMGEDVHRSVAQINLLVPFRTTLAVGSLSVTRFVGLLLRLTAFERVFKNQPARLAGRQHTGHCERGEYRSDRRSHR